MRTQARARAAVAMAALMVVGDASYAAGPAIQHRAVSCIVAGVFPRLDACFAPTEDLSRARVHFRAGGTPHWYFVDMAAAGECRSVLLPKPLPTTSAIDYYVSALGRTFDETRTSEYTPRVVAREGDCGDNLLVAGSAGSATVLLGAAAGAPAVPAGFAPEGIVAAPPSPGSAASQGGGGGAGSGSCSPSVPSAAEGISSTSSSRTTRSRRSPRRRPSTASGPARPARTDR